MFYQPLTCWLNNIAKEYVSKQNYTVNDEDFQKIYLSRSKSRDDDEIEVKPKVGTNSLTIIKSKIHKTLTVKYQFIAKYRLH